MTVLRKVGLVSIVVVVALSLAATTASAGTYKLSTSANSTSPPTSLTGELSTGPGDLTDNAGAVVVRCTAFTVPSGGASLKLSGGGGADGQTPSGDITAVSWGGCTEQIFGTACTVQGTNLPWSVTVFGDTSPTSSPKFRVANPNVTITCAAVGITCNVSAATMEAKVTTLSSPLSATFSTALAGSGYSNSLTRDAGSSGLCPNPGRFTGIFTLTGENPIGTKVAVKLTTY